MTRTDKHLAGEPGRLVLDGFPDLVVRVHVVPGAPRPPTAIVLSHASHPLSARVREIVDQNTAVRHPAALPLTKITVATECGSGHRCWPLREAPATSIANTVHN